MKVKVSKQIATLCLLLFWSILFTKLATDNDGNTNNVLKITSNHEGNDDEIGEQIEDEVG